MTRGSLTLMLVAIGLSGCGQEEQTTRQERVRPVLTTILREEKSQITPFVGTVEARVEAAYAFRVLGRITARPVNIGDRVAKGQLLASVDPTTLQLAVGSASARLSSAHASLDNARISLERQLDLYGSKATSEAALEEARQSFEASKASLAQAEASLTKAKEQLSYATVHAESDGIVRGISAEVGQTVSIGETVVTLAELGMRDVVLDVPDTALSSILVGAVFETKLQLDPEYRATAHVRQIAPDADALTRTWRVKLALENPPDAYRLGSIISAVSSNSGKAGLQIPVKSIFRRDGNDGRVWLVDSKTSTVSTVAVEFGTQHGDSIDIKSGLNPGSQVVVAGINSLEEGQSVRLEEEKQSD